MIDLTRVKEVFISVARCPNVRAVYSGAGGACSKIVEYQMTKYAAAQYEDFQVPEPWVGQIDLARILFLSSNPSIGEDDHSRGDTADDIMWEAHHLAHGGGSRKYILDGLYTTDRDGNRIEAQKYWSWVRNRVAEIIQHRPIRDGVDYALTEIVHCKSRNQVGVREAASTCARQHLNNVLSVAAARVVVAVGVIAQKQIFGLTVPPAEPVEMDLGGRMRTVVALAHPASAETGKTFTGRYSAESLKQLIAAVNE